MAPTRPGGRKTSKRARWAIGVLPLVGMLAFLGLVTFKTHAREQALRQRGVETQALVLSHDVARDDDYLIVRLLDCGCVVGVATDNVEKHPVGTMLPVRYDPHNKAHVRALVDAPNPYGPILPLAIGLGLMPFLIVPLLWVSLRNKRKAKALLTGRPTMRVRLEAWRRLPKGSNTAIFYVSVYPVGSPPGTEPMVVVPVNADVFADLRAGDVFDLYGPGDPGGPVALRSEDAEILSMSKTRDAEWESTKRLANSEVDLPPRDSPTRPAARASERLFANADEAISYDRLTRIERFLLPLFMLGLLVRVVPDRYIWPALGVLAVVLATSAAVGVRHAVLLNRIARRVTDAPARDRRTKRLARARATDLLNSEAGQAELAAYLHVSRDELVSRARRAVILMFGSMAASFLVMFALIALA